MFAGKNWKKKIKYWRSKHTEYNNLRCKRTHTPTKVILLVKDKIIKKMLYTAREDGRRGNTEIGFFISTVIVFSS